ncbi:MAG: hypothetical protein U1F43_15690 [Myxococcota bacterium]
MSTHSVALPRRALALALSLAALAGLGPAAARAAGPNGCDITGRIESASPKRLPVEIDPARHGYWLVTVAVTASAWHGPDAAMGCAGYADTTQTLIVPGRAYKKALVKPGQVVSGLVQPAEGFTSAFLTDLRAPSVPKVALLNVDESARGTTVKVAVGTRVVLVLHSTYWQIAPPSGDALAVTSGPDVKAEVGGIPGVGRGTVTVVYRADHAGTTVLSAARTSCGEAVRCSGDQGAFNATITVE